LKLSDSGRARRRGIAALLGSLLLGACATPPPGGAFSGRVAVASGSGAMQRSLYASFRLSLQDDGGRFELLSPLGQTVARADWSAAGASLSDGRSQRDYDSFEAMTTAALGLALPRAALQDWVRGVPAAGLPAQQLADGGFEQLGWQVRVQREDGHVHLLRATRSAGTPAQLSLVFDQGAAP
jgi:outer membrane lipoprotein LolB